MSKVAAPPSVSIHWICRLPVCALAGSELIWMIARAELASASAPIAKDRFIGRSSLVCPSMRICLISTSHTAKHELLGERCQIFGAHVAAAVVDEGITSRAGLLGVILRERFHPPAHVGLRLQEIVIDAQPQEMLAVAEVLMPVFDVPGGLRHLRRRRSRDDGAEEAQGL